jgi:hypothetical protein
MGLTDFIVVGTLRRAVTKKCADGTRSVPATFKASNTSKVSKLSNLARCFAIDRQICMLVGQVRGFSVPF